MSTQLLLLLQLCNSNCPLGAYSYSEGIETLVEKQIIDNSSSLEKWLINELKYGSIRVETAILIRAYYSFLAQNSTELLYWNNWLTASRETLELRQQNWQMGKSLLRLIKSLESENQFLLDTISCISDNCNYAIAFGITTACWQISLQNSVLGYFQNWVSNLVTVGVKLIPLGQTEGQKILLKINQIIPEVSAGILQIKDEDLASCSWGLSLASMQHETLYSRLFRS